MLVPFQIPAPTGRPCRTHCHSFRCEQRAVLVHGAVNQFLRPPFAESKTESSLSSRRVTTCSMEAASPVAAAIPAAVTSLSSRLAVSAARWGPVAAVGL